MAVLVLDGYNVVYAIPELEVQLDRSLQTAREALIRMCLGVAERGDVSRIDIVFDGRDEFQDLPQQILKKVRVIFSTSEEKADNRILEILNESRSGEYIIVSRDNYVFNHSKALCARTVSPAEFYRRYVKKEVPQQRRTENALSSETARKITEEYKKHLGI